MGAPNRGMSVVVVCIECGKSRNAYRRIGRELPARCLACDLNNRAGKKNGRWQGGITRPSAKGRSTREFKAWRLAVLERDGYACVQCGSTKSLHCDHIKAASLFPDLILDVQNGRVLCLECHKKTDTYLSNALRGRKFGPKKNKKTHCSRGHLFAEHGQTKEFKCRTCVSARNRISNTKRIATRLRLEGAAWWG